MSKTRSWKQRGRQRATMGRLILRMLWGGLSISAAVVVILAVQSVGGGNSPDFRVVAYQWQDILGGYEVDFSQLFRHGKPVILNFWAGQCPPCRAEMPNFQQVYDDFGEEFILVGVDVGPFLNLGSHDDARQFLKEFDIRYPTAYAVTRGPVVNYSVQAMPTTVFLTLDRKIFSKTTGHLSEDRLHGSLQDLLAAPS